MCKNPIRTRNASGFTLIELAIVLVIIGLIVGGILVGQDLIKAAEIRTTVAQYEKYNTAANTFRNKYNGIPGDLQAGATSGSVYSFGLCPPVGCTLGTLGLGDNNGLLQTPSGDAILSYGETLLFWQQLSAAGLIEGVYGMTFGASAEPIVNSTPATVGGYVPSAKVGKGNYWNAGSYGGVNYYMLSGFGSPTAIANNGTINFAKALTPVESYNIDSKLDDGMPNLGIIQARGTATTGLVYSDLATNNAAAWSTATPASAVAGDCMTTGANATDVANTYARSGAAGNGLGCILRLRFN